MSTPAPTFAHRLQDVAAGAVLRLLAILPEPAAQGFATGLGWFAGSVLRIRRGTIEENLRTAFPDRPATWRRRVASRVFPHIAREMVATLRLAGADPEEIRSRVRIEGLDFVRAAAERGRGAVIVTGHLGNWEIGGGALALAGVPVDVVAQPQSNPLSDARLEGARRRLGLRVIYRQRAPKEVIRALRRGRAVALVADQNARSGGIFVDFFGKPASTARGPALFALRAECPMIFAAVRRLPGWRPRYVLRFELLAPSEPRGGHADSPGNRPESGLADGGSTAAGSTLARDDAARRLTRRYLEALEEAVRNAPEQYFWPHKRWKTQPPQESSAEEPRAESPV